MLQGDVRNKSFGQRARATAWSINSGRTAGQGNGVAGAIENQEGTGA